MEELRDLQKVWSGTFRQDGRVSPDALPATKLSDYIRHDELFQSYPQLGDVNLQFSGLEPGANGYYDRGTNTITVSEKLRSAPEDVILHEVQHAIQREEGFAKGANWDYWNRRLEEGYDDLSARYPELFPEDIYNPADQMNRIIDVAEELQSVMGSAFEGAEADRAADFLAGDIMERFYDTPERAPTFADRQERRLQNQRVKDRARMDRAVEREQGRTERAKGRLQAQKTADRQRLMEAVAKERGRKNEALQALKDKHKAANKRRSENLSAAQRREQIVRHSKKLGEKLLRPSDKQHIPEELRGAAVALLRSINSESGYSVGEDGKRIKTGDGPEGTAIRWIRRSNLSPYRFSI